MLFLVIIRTGLIKIMFSMTNEKEEINNED